MPSKQDYTTVYLKNRYRRNTSLTRSQKQKTMKIRIIYAFTLAIILGSCGTLPNQSDQRSSQIITFHLKGKKYDQLSLKADIGGPNHLSNNKFFIGQSTDGYNWTFNIPDSINKMIDYYAIVTKPYDSKTNTYYCAKFKGLTNSDPSSYNFVFDEKCPSIEAKYIETKARSGVPGDGNYFAVNDTIIVDGISRSEDIFKVNFKGEDTELELSMKYPSFGFLDMDNYKTSVAEKSYIAQQYPDSKYLMRMFWNIAGDFKSVDDAKKIFDNFSEKNRSNGFGKEIGSYIKLYSSAFDNDSLKNSFSGSLEPIIIDFTKFNLIIFSASWCGPCHKLIPSLKEINNDLNDNLNMIYVSLDENNKVNDWIKLIKDNNIPWRSLLASGHTKEIEDKYDAADLPHMLLVNPDKTVKKIDLRNKEDKEKLYQLVKQKN